MTCRRGDIVLVLFPDSNMRTSKRRSALIVQADNLGADLPQTVVAMIASNMACAGHPSPVTVPVDGKAANGWGLLMDSVIMADNLVTIHYSDIDRVTRVHSVMTEVYAALRTTFGLRLPDSFDDVSESRLQIRAVLSGYRSWVV